MFGLGGVLTELLGDRVFAAAPITHADALALISRLKNQKLLNGFRGAKPLDRFTMADVLVRISALGVNFPRVIEVDINPLIVVDGQPVAVDAAIILKEDEQDD
jgi:acetyltransferase